MKVLIANYRYFISGGPEKYMFNISRQLEAKGHRVVPFSINSTRNVETAYSKYFIKPIGGMDRVYFSEYKKDLNTVRQLLERSFYSLEAKRAIKHEIKCENPDVVYILHFINKISPSIIDGAKEMKKRVVVRLSDYFMLCPRFDFLHRNEVCEECVTKGPLSCVRKRCVQDSFAASVVRVLSMKFHDIIRVYDKVDKFVCPSEFLAGKLIENGLSREKIIHIPTFASCSGITPSYAGDYILYYGRITPEKGVEYLVRALEYLDDKSKNLRIVGDDTTDEAVRLKSYIQQKGLDNIQFLGFKSGEELNSVIEGSRLVVVPSIWYDNMPNVILEAFANGKPVIATNMGSMPEIVEDNINGLLFKAKDIKDLALKIKAMDDDNKVAELGKNARRKVERVYSPEAHYNRLFEVLCGGEGA